MGILDFFGGGSPEEKARRLRSKVTQKYGEPTTRQKALQQLGEMKTPEAVRVLMSRFTITVEPATTDSDEKEHVFELIKAFGDMAVQPVREFLERNDAASTWAVRILEALLPIDAFITTCVEVLQKIGPDYTRDPEKKVVLIHKLGEKSDPRIGPALVPFLDDPSDDVKIAAIAALGPLKTEAAREPLLQLIVSEDTARRVKNAAIQAVHQSEFGVQGFREKVEAALADPWFVDKAGHIKKRG
ncbi:MAG: HEAT repeat domain-containing protein [Myxococcaceae bacterium]|nr:HEAT repeat domain-containing protein [Myxococcaceae bacterium]